MLAPKLMKALSRIIALVSVLLQRKYAHSAMYVCTLIRTLSRRHMFILVCSRAERICSRLVQFHHNVVDSIVGVGSSALSKAEADLLLQSSNKMDGGIHVVETVCETLERYLRECWKNTGIKDMADSIHAVTQ